jgi:hypothetical protein
VSVRTAGKRGRLPVKPEGERYAIRYVHEYLATPLPAPAYPVDVSGGITDWLMLGNGPDPSVPEHPDGVGDCGFAGRQHVRMAKAAGGHEPMPSETAAELVAEYLAYDHGQDVGVQLAEVLLSWYQAGKILAFAPVDHTAPAAVDSAMAAFRGAYCGVDLTDDADELFQEGKPWNVSGGQQPDPSEGHCIVKVGATGMLDTWVTWGALQEAMAGWTGACLTEAWVIITQEDADAASLDIARLRADIDALDGTGGNGSPAPAPAPDPAGLLAEFSTLVREIAASADRHITEAVEWLHSHGL